MTNLPCYRQELILSKNRHQRLVDTVKEFTDDRGYIFISKVKLAKILNCSTTLVCKYYTRLGLNDPCIEKVDIGAYRLRYTNLDTRGLFFTLEKCFNQIEKDSSGRITVESFYHNLSIREKALYLGITDYEVKVLDGYINILFTGSARGKVDRYVRKKQK